MNIKIQMVDTDTGEILYRQSRQLVCQDHSNDVAMKLINRVIASAIRGARGCGDPSKLRSIELKFWFSEPRESLTIPFECVQVNDIF